MQYVSFGLAVRYTYLLVDVDTSSTDDTWQRRGRSRVIYLYTATTTSKAEEPHGHNQRVGTWVDGG